MSTKMLKLGLYECDLNPALGLPIAGYTELKTATGFYDRLYVKAVSLNSKNSRYLVASVDTCGVGRKMCEEIGREMENKCGVARGNVVMMATHTHSAPDTMAWSPRMWSAPDKEDEVVANVVRTKEAIIWALSQAMDQEDVVDSISYSTVETPGFFTNRHNTAGSIDNQISVLKIKAKKTLLIVNHNYHPSVLGANNNYYSADFPAYLTRRITQELGDVQVNCITGSCGDVSARLTLGDEFSSRRNITNTIKYGNQLAERILRSLKSAVQLKDFTLSSLKKTLNLDLKTHPTMQEALERKHELETAIKEARNSREKTAINFQLEGILMWLGILNLSGGKLPSSLAVDVGAFKLGVDGFVLVYAPAEIYSTTGLKVKKHSKFKLTMLSGYGNGILGYIPPMESYQNEDYEALSTPVTSEAITRLEGTLLPLVS